MKYILYEEQNYDDLTRYAIECDEKIVIGVQKYLKKSGDFGEVVAILDTKPLFFDKLINASKWLKKEKIYRIKRVKRDKKAWNEAKSLTQKMLDEQYKRRKASQDAMMAGFGGNATFAAPIYYQRNIDEVQKEARSELRKSKKLLAMLVELTGDK